MALATSPTRINSARAGRTSNSNVLVSSAFLIPFNQKMITAHSTRDRILEMLERIGKNKGSNTEASMIVDISATTWNWDTYAIVAGNPVPIKLKFSDKDEINKYLTLIEVGDGKTVVQKGALVPQIPYRQENDGAGLVWVPEGSILKSINASSSRSSEMEEIDIMEFVFEAPVDPNNDRLEHFEQCVVDGEMIYKQRAKLAHACMRNMARFYNLDRIICWDLSWGIWEAVVVRGETGEDDSTDDGFPQMELLHEDSRSPFPTSLDDDGVVSMFYNYSRPVTPALLASNFKSASGYYLVGGNTYTMSLFHHMWDQQQQKEGSGHMQLLRDLLSENKIFYLGHSAGAIMSGPNILTATFKGIDAFSVVTQPYNAPFVRLPPSETFETFFVPPANKNNLLESRKHMIRKMEQYNAWRGYHVVEALTFPHYDSRPRFASFPQSAETYLRATNERGQFYQSIGSLLVGDSRDDRQEPSEVTKIREATNAKQLPCYPIANGHAIVLSCEGLEVVEALSPEEEEAGILHWDCYMPYVPDKNFEQFVLGRTSFKRGSFTDDANTIAGDRSHNLPYNGARLFARLAALGLPNPNSDEDGGRNSLFRTK